MAFMEPEIYHGAYAIVETRHDGTVYCPKGYEDIGDEETVEYARGYLGRLSASGCMDATDWAPINAKDKDEAVRQLCAQEDICPVCFEQCWDDVETECEGSK